MRGKKRPPEERVSNKAGPLPPCKICGETAAGFHYGVNTCEACKGFFRRSLVRKDEYICLGSGDCPIGENRRKSCPKCRYERCLEVGMSKDAIKTGRYTYKKRNQDSLEIKLVKQVQRETGMSTSQLVDIKDPATLLGYAANRGSNNNTPPPNYNDNGSSNSSDYDVSKSKTSASSLIEEDITASLLEHMQGLNAGGNDEKDDSCALYKKDDRHSTKEHYIPSVQCSVDVAKSKTSNTSDGIEFFASPTFQRRSSHMTLSSHSTPAISPASTPASSSGTCSSLALPESPFTSRSSPSRSSSVVSPYTLHDYPNPQVKVNSSPVSSKSFTGTRQADCGLCDSTGYRSSLLSSEPSMMQRFAEPNQSNRCGGFENAGPDQCLLSRGVCSNDEFCMDTSYGTDNSPRAVDSSEDYNGERHTLSSSLPHQRRKSKCGSEILGDAYTVLHDHDQSNVLADEQIQGAQRGTCDIPRQNYPIQQQQQHRHHPYQQPSRLSETFYHPKEDQVLQHQDSHYTQEVNIQHHNNPDYKIKMLNSDQEPEASPDQISKRIRYLKEKHGKSFNSRGLFVLLTNSDAESYSSPTLHQQLPACLAVPLSSVNRNDCPPEVERSNLGAVDPLRSTHSETSDPQTTRDNTQLPTEIPCPQHHSNTRKPLETVQKNSQDIGDGVFPSFFPSGNIGSTLCNNPIPDTTCHGSGDQPDQGSSHSKGTNNEDNPQVPLSGDGARQEDLTLPPLITWDPIPQVQYPEDELDELMSTVLSNHKRLIYDSLSLSDEFLQRGVRECKERCLLQDQVFGEMGFIEHAEYQHIYNSTGLDLDGRLEKIAHLADALDENVRHVISFVKTVPGFRDFSLNSQKDLLKASISELYFLGYYRGFLPGYHLIVDMKHAYCAHKILKLYPIEYTQKLFTAASALRNLKLSFKTIVVLKALCVFFPDRTQLEERHKCEVMLDKYMQCLLLQLKREFPDNHALVMAKLAQLLADLRVIEAMSLQVWQKRISQYETMANKPILVELFA